MTKADIQRDWPDWVIGEPIGGGGYGTVYEMHREVFGDVERKALKVIYIPKDNTEVEFLRAEGLSNETISTTFYGRMGDIAKEYKIMAKLRSNPNIVCCDDLKYTRQGDGIGWVIYIKMELLTPLMQALDQVQTESQILNLGIQMCNALTACQSVNIIHRDVKPQNILFSPNGTFKLGDFGISRTLEHTTKATAGIGTFNFMAPEVAKAQPYGPTVDIYSLGMVLYWLLNERREPFLAPSSDTLSYAQKDEAIVRRFSGEPLPMPKHGSDRLKLAVLKACAYDPKGRFCSAWEMKQELEAIARQAGSVNTALDKEATMYRDNPHCQDTSSISTITSYNISEDTVAEHTSKETVKPIQLQNKKSNLFLVFGAVAACIALTVIIVTFAYRSKETILANVKAMSTVEETIPTTHQAERFPSENVLRADPLGDISYGSDAADYPVFSSNLARKEILSVTFVNSLREAGDSAWDVSQSGNGTVKAWTEKKGNFYSLYIGAEGGVRAPENCSRLFAGYINLQEINFGDTFLTEHVTNMSGMFDGCKKLKALDLGCFQTAFVEDFSSMFFDCYALESLNISSFNTSAARSMSFMFSNCLQLNELDISGFDTSAVENMGFMFYNCQNLNHLDIHNLDTSSAVTMEYMFCECNSLSTLDISSFDTQNCVSMEAMFYNCSSLKVLDVSNFVTSGVWSMKAMFQGCNELAEIDVKNIDTSSAKDLSYMFDGCVNLTELDVSSFDTHNCTSMEGMFYNCSSLKSLDLSNFKVSNVYNISGKAALLPDLKATKASPSLTSLKQINDTNNGQTKRDILFGDFTSYLGDDLKDAIKFWVSNRSGYANTESVDLYLGSAYSQADTWFMAGEESDSETKMAIRFYGDGKLLAEVNNITLDTCKSQRVDVSGVDVLRIECVTDADAFGHCLVKGVVS